MFSKNLFLLFISAGLGISAMPVAGLGQTSAPVRPAPPTAQHKSYHLAAPTAEERSAAQPGHRTPVAGQSLTASPLTVESSDAPQMTTYSHGDPTAEEQYILELINRARANPAQEGVRLSTTNDPDIQQSYSQWGVSKTQVKNDFATYPSRPPLAFNPDLIASARRHSNDMLKNNFQSHTGSDGSTFDQRIEEAGYKNFTSIGENIFAYGTNLWMIHASFNIDFGNPGLGHRHNIMNDTDFVYREIGIGVLDGGNGLPDVGPIVTTEDFGARSQTFILGVAYDDKNKNGMYDVGEGLAGVTIKPSSGTYQAVTSTSGGYAIPFSSSGSVTITASGGPLATPVVKTVQFAGENVKVDFTPDNSGLPGPVTLVLPKTNDSLHTATAALRWNKVTGATKYFVEVATDQQFTNRIVKDSSITDTTTTLTKLTDGEHLYWRASARNAKGWGPASEVASFTVTLPPVAIELVAPSNATQVNIANVPLVNFIWRSGTPRVDRYWFELSKNTNFASDAVSDSTIADTTTTVLSTQLTEGATYYWRVRAHNESGWGTMSPVRTFMVNSAGVETADASSGVEIYPNPATTALNFRLTLSQPREVTIRIMNEAGGLVTLLPLGLLESGVHDVKWDAHSVAAGAYFYSIEGMGKPIEGWVAVRR